MGVREAIKGRYYALNSVGSRESVIGYGGMIPRKKNDKNGAILVHLKCKPIIV